jgi:septal ring factor EnvC (AmiA/AmiB activator)
MAFIKGQPVAVIPIILLIATFVLYRVAGKHVDELYARLRGKPADTKRLIDTQTTLIAEMKRYDEARETADKALKSLNDIRRELNETRRELRRAKQEIASLRNTRTRDHSAA